jgi:hypothetical protein
MRASGVRLDASVGATDAGWRASLEQAVDVTDARNKPRLNRQIGTPLLILGVTAR